VRDVLERNIMTQLRKIAFSALVYGALIIICLGGVVWGLASAFDGVLPIHWSPNIPMLEFPVDLLFYNFVMPFAIQSIKPSDGLHSIYDWWFHCCARMLRLSDFLFGERHPDEEGYHVRHTWRGFFSLTPGDTDNPVVTKRDRLEAEKQDVRAYFVPNGRFVRTPASDQVRIPKGTLVFLEVDENNERIDGGVDSKDGLHGKEKEMFMKVYVPPFFRLRIVFFILLIWIFAAITGVSLTIVPLVIGRRMISSFFPDPVRINDLYAFSIGLYSVGGTVYGIYIFRKRLGSFAVKLLSLILSPRQTIATVSRIILSAARLIFVAVTFTLILPSLFALLTELYVLVPLHTYLSGDQPHVIHFIQDWTLGVLYVQMAFKVVQWRPQSRLALALNAIIRNGWLRPNANLATRALLLPVAFVTIIAVFAPLLVGMVLNVTVFYNSVSFVQSQVYRYSYPSSLLLGLLIWSLYVLRRQIDVWRANIRDDVYLIGEQLHNFGEKKAREVGVSRRVDTS
jgi:E3 ubiquitin-protein ligase MARCH6